MIQSMPEENIWIDRKAVFNYDSSVVFLTAKPETGINPAAACIQSCSMTTTYCF